VKPSVARLYDRYYPRQSDGSRFADGTKTFYTWLSSADSFSDARVLNVGAGPTPDPRRRLRGKVGLLVGVDIDPVVLANEDLDEAYVTDGVSLPFPDASFDMAYSDWTLEHVENPIPVLREVRRVLKQGGQFLFRTTNLTHYVTWTSAHTPYWFHNLFANKVRNLTREDHEPWRTFYRMNTPATVRRNLTSAGFDEIEIQLIEPDPGYLVFHPAAFRVGVLYERLVNRWHWASSFRLILIARARTMHAPKEFGS
jgi:ubiquinone/menaquinone biosynthesis C-methylase UbiE